MPTLTEAPIDLVAAHTRRLRCPDCHRFIGTAGVEQVLCTRCMVIYQIQPNGLYLKAPK